MRYILQKLWQFKLPLVLLAIIAFAALLGPLLPVFVQRVFYSISLSLKEILVFVLPLIIFCLIVSSIVRLQNGAIKLIVLLLPMLCLSNFITTWIAYFSGTAIVGHVHLALVSGITDNDLQPLWSMTLPQLMDNRVAMIMALVLGLLTNVTVPEKGTLIADKLSSCINFLLINFFIPFMPLMILGFVIKMQHDDILLDLIHNYAYIFVAVCVAQVVYVTFLYFLVSNFKFSRFIYYLKNMLPPVITGCSTMSSAAALPYMLVATKANIEDEEVTNFVVPGTVNFHLIGDCIAIPIFALAIMVSFGFSVPSISEYLIFSLLFVLAKFGVAAVPGGGILVMWPILGTQLAFSDQMLTLIHALYLMFDPIITSINIMGNGAFAIAFKKISKIAKISA